MFNATFNTISVISWRSVLLAEETGVPGENHRPVTDKAGENHRPGTEKLYHTMLYQMYLVWTGFKLTTFVVIDTDFFRPVRSFASSLAHPRCFVLRFVLLIFYSFFWFSIMCLYVLSSVLWCQLRFPHKIDIRLFVEGLMSFLRYLCLSNTYCVVFLLCLSSSCVLYVASFSGLFIFDCPFHIL